jgi:hypothetical protein
VSRRKFARTATGVPALAALALAVAACSPQHPGAAATVGNTRVSVSALNTAVAVAVQTPDASTGQLPDRTTAVLSSLTQLIDEDLLNDGAKAKGVTVTEAEIQGYLADERQTNGSDAATASQFGVPLDRLHAVASQNVLISKLVTTIDPGVTDQNALQTALVAYVIQIAKHEGVSVNPRYGAWVPAHLSVETSNAFTTPVSAPPVSAPAG